MRTMTSTDQSKCYLKALKQDINHALSSIISKDPDKFGDENKKIKRLNFMSGRGMAEREFTESSTLNKTVYTDIKTIRSFYFHKKKK